MWSDKWSNLAPLGLTIAPMADVKWPMAYSGTLGLSYWPHGKSEGAMCIIWQPGAT
jgi:hypothetical protein